MPLKIPNSIKTAIGSVNESLKAYEAEWVSLKRCPWSDKERIHTLRQFLECRLNMEFFQIPELHGIVENFNGNLIQVVSVVGIDEKKRRFDYAVASINKSPSYYVGNEDFSIVLEKIENFIGGSKIQFNNSPKRPKITIT